MKQFLVNIPTNIVVGAGSLQVLGEKCEEFGKKALIVTTGKDMERFGVLGKVISILQGRGIEHAVYDEVTPNPKSSEIEKGAKFYKDENCDFIIMLGGGSSIDAGKNISMTVANNATIYDYLPEGALVTQLKRKKLPLIAIPTTAGTGSEATCTAVVTNDKTNEKYGVKNICNYPTVSIVDPELTLSVPKSVTAETGLDVFFHAMEAYFSNKATPFSDLLSVNSMQLVVENLEKAYHDGNNIDARSNMAWASTLGGIVLDNAICVGIHGLAQPVGGYIDAVHGKTLCAVFYSYMKYTWKSDIERYARISEILGADSKKYSKEQLAEMSADLLKEFVSKFNLKITLSQIGVKREMLDDITKSVLKTTRRTLECCKMEIGYNDIFAIYESAL